MGLIKKIFKPVRKVLDKANNTTLVKLASIIDEAELWLKSIDTSFSFVISRILFLLLKFWNAELIFSIVNSFFVQKIS